MKKKMIYLIPLVLCILLTVIHCEVVAKYRTKMQLTIPEVTVRLLSKTFDLPSVSGSFVYDGTEKAPTISAATSLSVDGTVTATNAGTYTITFSLPDPINDKWLDGTSGTKTYTWTIEKQKIEKPYIVDGTLIYTGEEQSPETSLYDTVYVTASGLTGENSQEYEAVFSLNDPTNTMWTDETTAPLLEPWDIFVCRIGDVYYHSVTDAFATDTSSSALPVTMLCDWEENCVNESGVDAFFLDGYTVKSSGTTMKNLASLSISGPGTLLASCDDMNSPTVCENTGTLMIASGVFRTEYVGASIGPNEAYGVLNQSGTTTISGGAFTVESKGLAAEPLCANGGTIIVEGGDFSAENSAATHGAYGGWLEGGEIIVRGGSFYAKNAVGITHGFDGTSGHLSVESGDVSVMSMNGNSGTCTRTQGSMTANISGGTMSLIGEGASGIFQAAGHSSILVSGGVHSARDTVSSAEFTHGFLIDGGTISVTGGTFSVSSAGGAGVKAAAAITGTYTLSGGTITAYAGANAIAYGCYIERGTAALGGMNFTIVSNFGHVIGLCAPDAAGSICATAGSATLIGKTVLLGQSASSSARINLSPNGSAFPFVVSYQSYYQNGSYWSATPSVTATQISAVPSEYLPLLMTASKAPLKSRKGAESSTLSGDDSGSETFWVDDMELSIGNLNEQLINIGRIKRGCWSVYHEEIGGETVISLISDDTMALGPSEIGEERQAAQISLGNIGLSETKSCIIIGAPQFFEGLTLGVDHTPLYGISEKGGTLAIVEMGWVLPYHSTNKEMAVFLWEDETGIIVKVELRSKVEGSFQTIGENMP